MQQKYKVFKCFGLVGVCFFLSNASFGMNGTSYDDYIKKLETGSKPSQEEIAGIFGHSENQKTEKLSKSLKDVDLKDSDSDNPLMKRVLEEKARRETPNRTLNPRDADYIKRLGMGSKLSREDVHKILMGEESAKRLSDKDLKNVTSNDPLAKEGPEKKTAMD